jgi:GNAT superfamily N-acetyltransferase
MPPPPASPVDLEIRRAGPSDHLAILSLAGRALGWDHPETDAELFRWKHLRNPFGPSPMWVAVQDGAIVGFRTFLRWEFEQSGYDIQRAVRAVDTATDPAAQGRGVFRRLTEHALREVRAEGADFIFNTPNDKSRPGYLKMGWEEVGRVPIAVRPRGLRGWRRMMRARVPAEKLSEPMAFGEAVDDVLGVADEVQLLLDRRPPSAGLATRLTIPYLAWRYGDGPITYRAVLLGPRIVDGLAFCRVRRRGGATELTICDVLGPEPAVVPNGVLRTLLDDGGADFAIRVRPRAQSGGGWYSMPSQGPILTFRELGHRGLPSMAEWDLCLGDIELF